jgi:cytochrome b pre-mRNA-processing protein 3
MREMGIGDLAVPKRMRKIGEVFYGRSAAFDSALSSENVAELAISLERNIPAADGRQVAVAALAAYMVASDKALAAVSKARLLGGELTFADPAAFLQEEQNNVDQAAEGKID